MSIEIKIEHNGKSYHGTIARIARTHLGSEDHGIFTATLQLDMDGSGISVGGYSLDTPVFKPGHYSKEFSHRRGSAFGLDHIMRIIETVGVPVWEDLKGQRCILLQDQPFGTAHGIASIDGSRVLIFKEHYADFEAELQDENLSETR